MKGHQDESEYTFDEPIFSFSIGNLAIFLLGGTNTDIEPDAIFLQSGDLLVMGGDTRVAFHGLLFFLSYI